MVLHYFEYLLILYFPTVVTSFGSDVAPVFEILLNNVVACDVQIIHDVRNKSIDWEKINLPVKIVTDFELDVKQPVRPYRINIFKTRVVTSCKFAILFSNHSLEMGGFYGFGKKLDTWIYAATFWHVFYYEGWWQADLRCKDSIMTIVTIKPKSDGPLRIHFWTGKYFKVSLLFSAVDNQLKFCVWFKNGLHRQIPSVYQGERHRCDAEGPVIIRGRSIVDITLDFELLKSLTWCYHRQFTTYTTYLKFDIYEQKGKNPFDARIHKSHLQNILGVIFNAANETLAQTSFCRGYDAILYDETNRIGFLDTTTVITIHTLGFAFISCYREEYLTFKFYITPFKLRLWVSLLISLITIIAITTVYLYAFRFTNASLHIWLYVLAKTFEEGGNLPGKLERNNFLRLILGSWCLMSVILTNCYNGIMITELNAPLDSSHPTLFDHLFCERISKNDTFKIFKRAQYYYKKKPPLFVQGEKLPTYGYERIGWYLAMLSYLRDSTKKDSSPHNPEHKQIQFANPFAERECFHLLSLPNGYVSGYANIPEFLDHLFRYLIFQVQYMEYPDTSASMNDMQLLDFFDPRHTHHPKGFQYLNRNQTFPQVQGSMERELVQCGKSVYISNSDVIEAEFNFITKQYPSKRFYKGKDIFEEVTYRWQILLEGMSNVPKYFKYLIESGIYRRLQMEEIYQKYLRRERFKPQTDIGAVALVKIAEKVGSFFCTESFIHHFVCKICKSPVNCGAK
ncbi:hypothetical protein Fcan01_24174 [Folsomia candida]|uniref:Uncharacterized protein n=1 Tax=Folsomia candida TaxID=158441 RepID=A0A226D6U2_FOLCA|nr:hypothetical protein Fcan01_24174 [Folsomia candida]